MTTLGTGSYARKLAPGLLIATSIRDAIARACTAFLRPSHPGAAVDPAIARARQMLDVARLATIALAGAIAVLQREASPTRAAVFCVLSVHAIVRARGGPVRNTVWVDASLAAAALALTGGALSMYVPYALVSAVWLGVAIGTVPGALASAAIAVATAPSVAKLVRHGSDTPALAFTWFVLFPLIGVSGGLMARIWRAHRSERVRMLADTNRALSDLYRLARAMPAGLELGRIAQEVVASAVRTVRAHGAAVIEVVAGVPSCVASEGDVDAEPLLDAVFDVTEPQAVTVAGRCWLVVPLWRRDEELGALAVLCDNHAHAHDLAVLEPIATEAALALDNAQLLRKLRELSIDEERQRIARDLHDGVAQSLTHLRLELDLNARIAPDDLKEPFERMMKVTDRAGFDVRAAIRGLRGGLAGGLTGSLEAYIAELSRRDGPKIVLDAEPGLRLPRAAEHEVFRIVQEAISNSLKHARARNVVVGMRRRNGSLRILVQDDGNGYDAGSSKRGVGLDAMRERADRIGARVLVESAPGDGARVMVEVPAR